MKAFSAFSLLLLAALSGPAIAETAAAAPLAGEVQLVGPVASTAADATADATVDFEALRVTVRDQVSACMKRMQTDAYRRRGSAITNNSHTNRARFLACDAAVRAQMAAPSN